jgi:hypothetical protein
VNKAKQIWQKLRGANLQSTRCFICDKWQKNRYHARWILYIFIALVAVALESGGEFLTLLGISEGDDEIVPSMMYQRFATAGHRKPRPHFVRLIVMSQTYDPSVFANKCEKREFEAALLRRAMDLSPAVIALDFWYSPQPCTAGEDAQKSNTLKTAISEVSNHIPIVIGLGSHTKHEFEKAKDPDLPQLEKFGFSRKDQVMDDSLNFGDDNISYGLARLELDTRGIPILWDVYANKDAVRSKSRQRLPGLAYAAAILRDTKLPDVLAKINKADEHPFTSFIPESDFEPVRAIDLLCGRTLSPDENWRTCKAADLRNDPRFSRLKAGQIFLIAENTDEDHHKSVIGELPGYVLQANYLESLLDDRCFRRINPLVEIILTLAGVIVIVILFEKITGTFMALAWGYVFVALIAGLCNMLGMYFGFFIGFWIPLITIPIVEMIFIWRRKTVPKPSP